MRRVLAVGWTEFLNTILSKGFVLAVTLTPLIMGISITAQNYLREHASSSEQKIAVIDETGLILEDLIERAGRRNAAQAYKDYPGGKRQIKALYIPFDAGEAPLEELARQVRDEEIFAYLLIGKNALDYEAADAIVYHTGTPTNITLPQWLEAALNARIMKLRIRREGVDPELLTRVTRPVPMSRRNVHIEGGEGIHIGATFGVPAAAMFLLFILVFLSAPMLLHSVLEEKQQRIWEVLVSSVSPFKLLLGKLLGAVLVSMLLAVFYLAGAAILAEVLGVADAVAPSLYAWFLFFQLLAIVIYGSMFSAIGAACSEIRDAQSLMMPAMLLIVLPMFGWVAILRAPTSLLAKALSLFPPATPMLMLLRIALPPGPAAWEIGLSIVLTTAFSLACVWVAGKIFRLGILAQGQTPTLRRLLAWVAAK